MKPIFPLVAAALILLGTTTARGEDRPVLGISVLDDAAGGARVVDVYVGGPAANAGLKPGDRIVAIDKKPVSQSSDLIQAIAAGKLNSQVKLDVMQSDGHATLTATLGRDQQVFQAPVMIAPVAFRYQPMIRSYSPQYQSAPAHPRLYNFFNRPDLSGPHIEPPPIPPTPPSPPFIPNP